jgi:prepilin-type N-terminal cleavage/methylation domain-containing protein
MTRLASLAKLGGERGMTLPEVLIAMAILTIGCLGVVGSLAVATGGVAGSATTGQAAIERGFAVSTAVMLGEEWIEQIKRVTYTAATDNLTPVSPSAPTGFSDEAFAGISGYPNYSRQVRVFASEPGTNMKTVKVTVRYRYSTLIGMSEGGITLASVIARRE